MQKRIWFILALFVIFACVFVYAQDIGVCIAVYDPVCGIDGNNYGNECEAKQAGVDVACKGECPCAVDVDDNENVVDDEGKGWFARFIDFFKGLFKKEVKYSPSELDGLELSDSGLGYIVKLKDPPLLSLEESLVEESGEVLMSPDEDGKNKIINAHKNSKSKVINKLKSKSKISGKAIDEISEDMVLGDYVNTFNGFALNISREDAIEISKMEEVERVYPNLPVNITLMDSVPLIGADDVWNMQINGTNITGKDIKIAIIDTGVDYTHGDLGGEGSINYDFLNKITRNLSLGYLFPDTLQISGSKVYFLYKNNIYYYDYNINNIAKLTLNNSYLYSSFFVVNNILVSVVFNQDKYSVVSFDLGNNNKESLVVPQMPLFRKEMNIQHALLAESYLCLEIRTNYTTGDYAPGAREIFTLYLYNFDTNRIEYSHTGQAGTSHGPCVVSNNKLYYRNSSNYRDICVYDLENKTYSDQIKESSISFIQDSFGDEILVSLLSEKKYEILNTKTNAREYIDYSAQAQSSSTEVKQNFVWLILSHPGQLAVFNKQIVVYETRGDKFFIYDRINNKTISLTNLPYRFYEVALQKNRICFSSNKGVFCIDYNSSKEYFIPRPDFPTRKVIGGYDVINGDSDPMDDHGHGTHVAATAAGNGILKGVAPDAKIYAYKVLDDRGYGSFASIIGGVERAIDPNQDGDFSDKADIISMSLGADCGEYSDECGPDDPMSQAIDNVVSKGVVAVIAAGNSGPGERTINSPGTARKAITVGATFKKDYEGIYWKVENPRVDDVTPFSSRGPIVINKTNILLKPDVVAPGAIICAAAQYDSVLDDRKCFDDKHIAISGTSMATPHVAGAIALIKQAHSDWTPEEIKMALRSSAKDLGHNISLQGYGRIQVLNAVNMTKPIFCNDSDGGKNYYLKGNVFGNVGDGNSEFSDYCLDNSSLIERFCSGDPTNFTILYVCPYRCKDGACVNKTETPKVCNDSDGGVNLYVKGTKSGINIIETGKEGPELHVLSSNKIIFEGVNYTLGDYVLIPSFPEARTKLTDITFISLGNPQNSIETTYETLVDQCATGNTLIEQSCDSRSRFGDSYKCPNGCENGVCRANLSTSFCNDSDGGKNYFKKGFVKGEANDSGHWDVCASDKKLVEYYCNNVSEGEKQEYACPSSCKDGICDNYIYNSKFDEKVESVKSVETVPLNKWGVFGNVKVNKDGKNNYLEMGAYPSDKVGVFGAQKLEVVGDVSNYKLDAMAEFECISGSHPVCKQNPSFCKGKCEAYLKLEFLDAKDKVLDSEKVKIIGENTYKWKKQSLKSKVPKKTKFVRASVGFDKGNRGGLKVDDVVLQGY